MSLVMRALEGLPEIREGDDLGALLLEALGSSGLNVGDGDILVLAHKVVSKSEGRLVSLASVEASPEARQLAEIVNKDPRKVEVVLRESARVVRAKRHEGHREGILICEHRLGFVSANAAVDESNIPDRETVALLPEDPDASADRLRARLAAATGKRLGVIIADTFGRPWRKGVVNVAVGLAGVPAIDDGTGREDRFGRQLKASASGFADEVAAAAGLLMPKAGGRPAVWVQGLHWVSHRSSAKDMLRPDGEDLFR